MQGREGRQRSAESYQLNWRICSVCLIPWGDQRLKAKKAFYTSIFFQEKKKTVSWYDLLYSLVSPSILILALPDHGLHSWLKCVEFAMHFIIKTDLKVICQVFSHFLETGGDGIGFSLSFSQWLDRFILTKIVKGLQYYFIRKCELLPLTLRRCHRRITGKSDPGCC